MDDVRDLELEKRRQFVKVAGRARGVPHGVTEFPLSREAFDRSRAATVEARYLDSFLEELLSRCGAISSQSTILPPPA